MPRAETPKTRPEKNERVEARQSKREDLPKQKESTVDSLQEFLMQIKLFSLLKKQDPGSTNFEKIKQLEAKLSSSDKLERAEAREKIDLFASKMGEAQRDANKPLVDVVNQIFDPESSGKPPRLNELVGEITNQNSIISEKVASNSKISETELKAFEASLVELKEVMGIPDETREGLAEMKETLIKAQELRKVRRHMENPKAYEPPLLKKKEFFEAGSATEESDKKLTIREAKKSKRSYLESHLENVKTHVRDELINDNGAKLKALEGEDLLDRLEEIGDLKARARNLVGRNHNKLDETLEALTSAESQYQVALEERIVEDLKAGKIEANKLAVGEALREVLSDAKENTKGNGRNRYKFDASYEKIATEVYGKSRRLVSQGYGVPPIEESAEAFEAAAEQYGMGRSREATLQQKGKELKHVFQEANIDIDETIREMHKIEGNDERDTFQQRLKYAKQVEHSFPEHLDASQKKMMAQFLESAASNEKFLGVQVKLKEYVREGKLGEYLVELKAYIARIGLRETSADFEFAFLLRDAKDVISRYEPDIADEFDGWQSSLFIPPVKSVSPEMYRGIFEKVWGAGNLDHVFNPGYANAEAMSININGERKNISTAVFYQLLQQTENSNKLLNAKVNSSDSTMFGILAEYLYGKGTKIEGMADLSKAKIIAKDGTTVLFDAGRGDVFDVQYFDLVSKNLQEGAKRSLVLSEMLDQATWMERYAINFWSYSGEAGNHYRHYPKEDMENANKWLFAQDQMFEGYSGHFGKYDPPFWEIAKLTHMLREIRSYKDGGIIKGATTETLEKAGIGGKRAAEIAELFNNKLTKKMTIDGKTFKVGLLTLEDARLIGNNYSSPLEAWSERGQDWLAAHGTPKEMIINSEKMKDILDRRRRGGALSDLEKDWAIQADEFFDLCNDLKWTAAERRIVAGITEAELKPLADKVSTIFGTEWKPKNMSEFMEKFEYASVMDLGKYNQGSDPTEYAQKYMKLAEEVAKKLPQIQKGVATSKEILELQTAMRAYLTPEEVDAFFEILTRKTILTHTFQTNKYEIAKLNDDQRTINYKKLKGSDGHVYYFVGKDGHRIANTESYRGAYFNRKYGTKTWRQSDVETLLDAMKGQAMLPRQIAESMLDDLVGGGRSIDKMFSIFGIDTKTSKGAKLFKAAIARSKRLIGRLPLFDDPAWAAWSLSVELMKFISEASKEVTKSAIK